MLVIEGSDHLGKTTMAKRIVELAAEDARYPIRYQHMSRQNKSFDYNMDYLDFISKHAVQDRFHLGGLVWHPEGTVKPSALENLKRWFEDTASMVIVIYTSDEEWYEDRLLNHGKQEMFSVPKLLEANRQFSRLGIMEGMADYTFDIHDGKYPGMDTCRYFLELWYQRLDKKHNTRRMYVAR